MLRFDSAPGGNYLDPKFGIGFLNCIISMCFVIMLSTFTCRQKEKVDVAREYLNVSELNNVYGRK